MAIDETRPPPPPYPDDENRDTMRMLRRAHLYEVMERVLKDTIAWFDQAYTLAEPTHAIREILARVKEERGR